MNRTFTALLAAAVLLLPATSLLAADAGTVTCKDGTSSKGGRGACRGHGGINKDAAAAATAAAPAEAPAAAAANLVTCKDGSSSKGGRGACRGHGGIKKDTAPAAQSSAPAAAPAATPAAAAPAAAAPAPAAKSAATSAGGSGKSVSSDPTGAIAQCKDGSYSHSKGHKGACSRHGGVEKWLDQG